VISNDLGMLLRLIGSESRKWILSTNTLRILLPFIINCGSHLSSRNLLSRNCALYPRDLCEITNLIRERRNSRIYSINLPTGSCQNEWIRFPHCSQSTLLSSTVSHLKHFLSTYVVRYLFERSITLFKFLCPLCFEGNVQNFSDNLLGFSGATFQKWPEGCFL